MCSLAILFTLTRIVYRQWLTQLGLGADDWTTIITALTCIGAAYLNTRMAEYGVGQDIWTLTPYQITMFGQMFWYLAMVYFLDIALLKLSILFFFLRIFPDVKFRRTILISIAIVGMFGIAHVVAAIFQCWPISYNWTKWNDRDHQGRCVNTAHLAWANAAVSIALDLWMLYLPLSQISTLKLDFSKKLSISASKPPASSCTITAGTTVMLELTWPCSVYGWYLCHGRLHHSAGLTRPVQQQRERHTRHGRYRVVVDCGDHHWRHMCLHAFEYVDVSREVPCPNTDCLANYGPLVRLILGRLWPNVFGSVATTTTGNQYPRSGGGYPSGKNSTAAGDQQQVQRSASHASRLTTNTITTATSKSGSRFSSYGRPTSFFSGQNGEGRLQRIESTDDDAIQLRSHISQKPSSVHSTDGTSTASSELYLPLDGADQQGTKVMTTIDVRP